MISFTVPGKPEPWRRSRTNGKRHFKDAKTATNQLAWGFAARAAMKGSAPLSGPLVATVDAYFPIPKAASKATRAAMVSGQIPYLPRPDAENLAKNLDGLNGVAFADDAQIVRLVVSKFYAEAPCVKVRIEPYVWLAKIGTPA